MNIDFSGEDEDIVYRLQTISTTLQYISEAYSHFYAYSFGRVPFERNNQRRNHPLLFHRMNFQFFLTIQLCKLYEKSNRGDNSISSLIILNDKLKDKYPEYQNQYDDVTQDIEYVKNTDIYKKLKELRDKAYAHSDRHEVNTPLRFIFLTEDRASQIKTVLEKSIEIYNKWYGIYGRTYTFRHVYDSTTPKKFLSNSFRYKDFFHKYARGLRLRDASNGIKSVIALLEKEREEASLDNDMQIESINKLKEIENLIANMLESAYEKD